MRWALLISLSLLLLLHCSYTVSVVNEWDLPVFPLVPPSKEFFSTHTPHDKLVPRHLWIAVRNKSEEVNVQVIVTTTTTSVTTVKSYYANIQPKMPGLFERNANWHVHIEGNEEKDFFMNKVFANTSLLWAYNILSSEVGAAKADIW